jgi:endoglucanase
MLFTVYAQSVSKNDTSDNALITYSYGGIVRADSTKKEIALVFTGDEFGDGLFSITETLKKQNIRGSFFFTGRFYRNHLFQPYIKQLYKNGNYLGPHSDAHLLYCDWNNRDSLLVTKQTFTTDLRQNLEAIKNLGIDIFKIHYFIPPYEWWNDSIAAWSREEGLQIINFTPGIRTNADYTYPEMGDSYKSSEWIIQSLKQFAAQNKSGLSGSIILIHAGTDARRKDKLYSRLTGLIDYLKSLGYHFKRVDELLE